MALSLEDFMSITKQQREEDLAERAIELDTLKDHINQCVKDEVDTALKPINDKSLKNLRLKFVK